MLFSYIKRTYIIGILFFVLSLIITLSWFKSGLYYGGAEVGVGPYYHPSRYLDIQKFIWWDSTAPGGLVPQFIVGVPLYFTLSLLENIFSPLILQAALFFCLLFMMGYGMYLFAFLFLDKSKTFYAFLAGLFYMLNSYMMVAVWHRFLYTGFFLGASLPVLALFWKLWIDKGKFIFLFLFLLTNLVFVYMYANLTSTLVVWILCFLLTTTKVIFPWQGKKSCLNTTSKFLLGLSLFLLTNLWWLIPIFKVSTQVLPQQHSSENNIRTLVNISKQTILPFTLQYANPFYLFYTKELGEIYTSFIFRLLPWLPAIVILIGILVSLRNKIFASFGLFYLLAILIAKGAASPFGYPYIWGFMNTFSMGVIRNPFEKLGILLPFFGSILFVIGLERLLSFFTKKFGPFIAKSAISIVLLSVLIYAFPMFTGRVFNKPDYPLKVKVPQTYEQANTWFKTQKNLQGNLLHLPFPDRDVVTYNWEHGYHGVEINEILFTALPSITRNVGIKRVDDTLKSLSFIFNKPFVNNDQILNILQSFNVGYIVLHKDTRWDDVPTYGKNIKLNNPSSLKDTLDHLSFLDKSVEFGDLVIYKSKDEFYKPKIVLSNNYDLIDPGEANILQILELSQLSNQVTFVDTKIDDIVWDNSSKVSIYPETILYNWEPSKEVLESILNQSVANPNDPSFPFNQLQEIKKRVFSQTGELLSETIVNKVILANSYIMELNKERINNTISSQSVLKNYDDQIEKIFTGKFEGSSLKRSFKHVLAKVFTLHLYILRQFYESGNNNEKQYAKEIYTKLNSYLIDTHILPKFFSIGKEKGDSIQRRVHLFNVPVKDEYELLFTDMGILKLYQEALKNLDIQIDGKSVIVKTAGSGDVASLLKVELERGKHEISYITRYSSNLASDLNLFVLEGGSKLIDNQLKLTANSQTGSAATLTFPKANGGDIYEITFEALTDNVNKFYIEMLEDLEADDSVDNCAKTSCYPLESSPISKDWSKFSLTTTPLNEATQQVKLRILLPFDYNFAPDSIVQIRNLQINRLMDNNLILRKTPVNQPLISTPSAYLSELKKISPVKYEGKIKLDKSSFMFFKETFHPGWILEIKNGETTHRIDKHFLGNLYGNAYYIDKVGEYEFDLEFEPQKYVDYGIITSIAGWIGVLAILIYSEIKRKYESK